MLFRDHVYNHPPSQSLAKTLKGLVFGVQGLRSVEYACAV